MLFSLVRSYYRLVHMHTYASAKTLTHARACITIYLFIGNRVKAIKWKIALSSFDFDIAFYNTHSHTHMEI